MTRQMSELVYVFHVRKLNARSSDPNRSFQTLEIHPRNIFMYHIFAGAVQASLVFFENMGSSFSGQKNRFAHVIAVGLSAASYKFRTKF